MHVDVLGRDRLDLAFAELAVENADHVAVVAHRGRLAVADVLAVGEPLGRRVREGLAGFDHAGKRAIAHLAEQLVQMRLRLAFREVAVGRRGLLGPRWPEPPFLLAPIRQPVLRVPDRTALPLTLEDVTGDRAGRWLSHRSPNSSAFRDQFGTNFATLYRTALIYLAL